MIQIDERLGGEVRYLLTKFPVLLMAIPDEVRKCVIFVGYRMADGSGRRGVPGGDRGLFFAGELL